MNDQGLFFDFFATKPLEVMLSKDHWPVKTMIVSTFQGDKLIFAAVTSFAHPESLREFLYSLRFD